MNKRFFKYSGNRELRKKKIGLLRKLQYNFYIGNVRLISNLIFSLVSRGIYFM